MKVLNVGGNSKEIPLPAIYDSWQQVLLDIDPKSGADIICDARDMLGIKERFDSVYCSHCLEHFYSFDVPAVLKGFKKVLNKTGFIYIRVPDLLEVIKNTVDKKIDLNETLYHSMAGPITPLDILFGLQKEVKRSGQDFFAHKTGFSAKTMRQTLQEAGFKHINIAQRDLELIVFAGYKLK